MQRRIPFLVVLVMTLILLAACGGDDGSSSEPIPTNPPASDTAPASEPAADEEVEAAAEEVEAAAEEAEAEPAPAEEVEPAEEAPAAEEVEAEAAGGEEAYPAPQPAAVDEPEAYPQAASVPEPIDPYPEAGAEASDEGQPSGASGARTFQIASQESNASYTVDEEFFGGAVSQLGKDLGFFTAIGLTNEVNGQLVLNFEGAPSLESGEVTVDISTLTSDDDRRDGRIREKHLQSATYPLAQFIASGIEGAPASYEEGQEVAFKLVGEMTIREITKPATFDVTAKLEGDTITGVATTQLLMTDFGFDPPDIGDFLKAENEVLVTVNLTAKETTQ
ncbi:MAG: YceI family protein [Ardenticatenaceae bacterium]